MLCFGTLLSETLGTLTDHASLQTQAQAVLALVFLEALGAAPAAYHLSRLEEDCLLYLVVVPLLARLVHDHVVFHQPRFQNLFINSCVEHIFVHLAQELIQLLLVLGEFVALLVQQVLDSLAIDGPMSEWHLWDGQAVF